MTNSITEAPKGMLDMNTGGSTDTAFSNLQNEFISHAIKDQNSALGGFLSGADNAVADGLFEADDAVAKGIGADKAMPVTIAAQTPKETAGLISKEGSKQFLNIPNIYDQVAKTESTYTPNGIAAADKKLFDSQQVTV